jgi:hypothetical protein
MASQAVAVLGAKCFHPRALVRSLRWKGCPTKECGQFGERESGEKKKGKDALWPGEWYRAVTRRLAWRRSPFSMSQKLKSPVLKRRQLRYLTLNLETRPACAPQLVPPDRKSGNSQIRCKYLFYSLVLKTRSKVLSLCEISIEILLHIPTKFENTKSSRCGDVDARSQKTNLRTANNSVMRH